MDKHQSIITKSPEETAALGQTLASSVTRVKGRGLSLGSRIYCLYGDLGSGKTTFVQGFAKGMGITSRLLSPTFIIVRRYEVPKTNGFLYHLDLYRLQLFSNLEELGMNEMLHDNQSCVIIEWAEKLGDVKPSIRTDISFTTTKDGHRIDMQAYI